MPEGTSLGVRDGEGIHWPSKVTFRGKGVSGLWVSFEADHTMFSRDPATLFFVINFVVIDMSCMTRTRLTSTALPEVGTSTGKFVWTEPNDAPRVASMEHSA